MKKKILEKTSYTKNGVRSPKTERAHPQPQRVLQPKLQLKQKLVGILKNLRGKTAGNETYSESALSIRKLLHLPTGPAAAAKAGAEGNFKASAFPAAESAQLSLAIAPAPTSAPS